ncbi:MAG: hypothetical protein AB7N76_15890 [Planctomycetota bacterium]
MSTPRRLRLRLRLPPRELLLLALLWGLVGAPVVEAVAHVLGRPAAPAATAGLAGPLRQDLLALGDLALALLLALALRPKDSEARALERLPRPPLLVRGGSLLSLGVLGAAVLLRWVGLTASAMRAGLAAPGGEVVALDLGRALVVATLGGGLLGCGRWVFLAAATLWCALRLSPFAALDPLGLSSASASCWVVWIALAAAAVLTSQVHGPSLRAFGAACLRSRGGGFLGGTLELWGLSLAVTTGTLLLAGEPARRGLEIPRPRVVVHTATGRFEHDARRPREVAALLGHAAAIASALRADFPGLALETPHDDDQRPGAPAPVALDGRRLRAGAFGLARGLAERATEQALGAAAAQDRAARSLGAGYGLRAALRASDHDPFWARFQVAVAFARGALAPEDLWDGVALERDLGRELAGPLGEAALAALARRRGEDAPRRLLAAWRTLPSALPYDSDACRERWTRALKPLELTPEELWSALAELVLAARDDARSAFALPRLRLILELQDQPPGWLAIAQPDEPLPRGWRIVCRGRFDAGDRWGALEPRPVGTGLDGLQGFHFPARDFRPPPWVQLGLVKDDDPLLQRGLWEPWSRLEEKE